MTSMPASRRALAMILAPRSCPSRPGLATTTRILRVLTRRRLSGGGGATAQPGAERERHQAEHGQAAGVEARSGKRGGGAVAGAGFGAGGIGARDVRAVVAGTGVAGAGLAAGPAAAGRRAHGQGAAHVRVRRAEVAEGAGLVEGVRAALAGTVDASVEAAVLGGRGMRRGSLVRPRDRVARVDRDRPGRELEVADGDGRRGGRPGPRPAIGATASAPRLGLGG